MQDVTVDYVNNGQVHGNTAQMLMNAGFDENVLRPMINERGQHIRVVKNRMTGGYDEIPLSNATATLRKDEWKLFDAAIIPAARERLRAVMDLENAGLTFNVPNGMSKTVLETETMSQITDAEINMDGINATSADAPHYELTNLPLPIISKGFSFTARQLATSRERGNPLDTTTAEEAARRVAEMMEKQLTGIASNYTYGGGTIYGYTTHPSRNTKTDLTTPTGSNGTTVVTEILELRQALEDDFHYGPYALYFSSAWNQFLDDEFKSNSGLTLRQRIQAIDGIRSVRTLDYLTSNQSAYVAVMVQMTSNVVRMVKGMDIRTIQWPSDGGLQLNFKVMAINVPQIRDDINDNIGLMHATTS